MEKMVNPSSKFWSNKRVLVTGHTGFKGSWLCHWLNHMGAEVSGLALPPETTPDLFSLSKLEDHLSSYIADIRKFDEIVNVMNKVQPEIVIHMAAQALVRESYSSPRETYETNVMGTVNVLDAIRQTPSVKTIVNITTDKCYENKEWLWAYRENEPMGGYDPYSSSKACAELVTSAYRQSFFQTKAKGIPSVGIASVRAGNVIGGGDWADDRLIPDCVRALMADKPVLIRNKNAIRPWQHVLEPLAGYLILAEKLWTDPEAYSEGWNFGPSEEDAKPVDWVVEKALLSWGDNKGCAVQPGEHPHEANYLKLDSSKARVRLGWSPKLNISEAIEYTINWYSRYHAGDNIQSIIHDQINNYENLKGQYR